MIILTLKIIILGPKTVGIGIFRKYKNVNVNKRGIYGNGIGDFGSNKCNSGNILVNEW